MIFKKKKKMSEPDKVVELIGIMYSSINPYQMSRQERQRLGWDNDAYIYGEITFASFYAALTIADPQITDVFYDIGSGVGKAVFLPGLCFDLSKACGIEILPALHAVARTKLQEIAPLIQTQFPDCPDKLLKRLSTIQFINDDFLNVDFSDGDIVFVSATCLSYPTWEKMIEKLSDLKSGSRIIVLTKKIEHQQFELMSEEMMPMSWGLSTVRIYRVK